MPRKKRTRSGTAPERSRASPGVKTTRAKIRGAVNATAAGLNNTAPRGSRKSRKALAGTGDTLRNRPRRKRAPLPRVPPSRKRPGRVLPGLGVSAPNRDAAAPSKKAARSACTRKKEVRRAVILAQGKGGIHGRRKLNKRIC